MVASTRDRSGMPEISWRASAVKMLRQHRPRRKASGARTVPRPSKPDGPYRGLVRALCTTWRVSTSHRPGRPTLWQPERSARQPERTASSDKTPLPKRQRAATSRAAGGSASPRRTTDAARGSRMRHVDARLEVPSVRVTACGSCAPRCVLPCFPDVTRKWVTPRRIRQPSSLRRKRASAGSQGAGRSVRSDHAAVAHRLLRTALQPGRGQGCTGSPFAYHFGCPDRQPRSNAVLPHPPSLNCCHRDPDRPLDEGGRAEADVMEQRWTALGRTSGSWRRAPEPAREGLPQLIRSRVYRC